MSTVTFLPAGISIVVTDGTPIIDAARQAGIMLGLPCGGKGTCGKCLVQVSAGAVAFKPVTPLSDDEQAAGWVHACQAAIIADVTIAVPDSGKPAAAPDDNLDSAPSPAWEDLAPLTRQVCLHVPGPEPEDGLADLDRLSNALAQSGVAGKGPGESFLGQKVSPWIFPLDVIRKLGATLRAEGGRVTVTVDTGDGRIIDVGSGHAPRPHLGIAVDLGTTTVAVQLIDLKTGKILATRNGYNDQIRCGLDVISRINYASTPARLEDLRTQALNSTNRLIRENCADAAVREDAITGCMLAGNTVMTHLLLGLDPEYIRREPYTPTVLDIPPLAAGELGLAIHPAAAVHLSPCVGSYVGGDITAGVLVTDLAQGRDEIFLFIDIGTNGEIVLGNRDFLMTCACSAGPAFEGGGIGCGMRATTGAIDRVTIARDTGQASFSTIGNVAPSGVCGSGLIDLLAGLFLTGWIDPSGKLERTRPCASIHGEGRRAYYTLAAADQTAGGKPIVVSESDIENLMRAKAAIYAAASVLLAQVGIGIHALARFFIAGGFGGHLDIENAKAIGLLPDIPSARFAYVGNASLAGAGLCLGSERYRHMRTALTRRMTYIDLSSLPGYMDQYTAALFLPHTDRALFPHVIKSSIPPLDLKGG